MSQLVQLEKDQAMFMDKGAKIIALAVQDQAGAAQSVDATKAEFPILADADHHVADQYGVFDLLTDVSIRGKAAPAVFIVDQSDHIRWSHIAANINDRPWNQTILENLPK
jgi:peroxiredoxin